MFVSYFCEETCHTFVQIQHDGLAASGNMVRGWLTIFFLPALMSGRAVFVTASVSLFGYNLGRASRAVPGLWLRFLIQGGDTWPNAFSNAPFKSINISQTSHH